VYIQCAIKFPTEKSSAKIWLVLVLVLVLLRKVISMVAAEFQSS